MAQAFDRPRCTATITGDDTVEVSIDGVVTPFDSLEAAIAHLAETAGILGRPVKVAALDPSSPTEPQAHLIVDEHGTIAADTARRAASPRRRGGRIVALEDIAPAHDHTEPALTEPERLPQGRHAAALSSQNF